MREILIDVRAASLREEHGHEGEEWHDLPRELPACHRFQMKLLPMSHLGVASAHTQAPLPTMKELDDITTSAKHGEQMVSSPTTMS